MSAEPASPQPPQLGLLLLGGQQWLTSSLLNLMARLGHRDLTAAHLMFLSNLDCGDTYASEVARRMGVTRQAVYRTTREMQRLKILTLQTDAKRKTQKVIRMTAHGQRVVRDARASLDEIEVALEARIGARDLAKLASILGKDWGPPLGMN